MKLFSDKGKDGESGKKTTDEWIASGQEYYNQNKFSEAIECYNEALKHDPDNVTVWGEKGKANYKLENYEDSLDDLEHAIRMDPEYVMGYYLKAFPLVQLKQYTEAVESFKIFQENAGPEYERELEIARNNLKTLLKHGVNKFDDYKRIFPLKDQFDITSTDLEVEGRLKDRIVKIYGQMNGLRFCDVDFLDKIKEDLFFIRYNQIDSIEFEKSVLSGKILLNAEGAQFIINCFSSRDGRSFVDRVQERISQTKPLLKTDKPSKFLGYNRKTRSEVEISISGDGISIKNREDTNGVHAQLFNYEDIESVKFHESLLNIHEGVQRGELVIKLKNKSEIEMNKVDSTDGRYIEDVVQEKLFKVGTVFHEKLKSLSTEGSMIKHETDPLDEIEKAKKLLDMGAITEKQFEEIKNKCLKKLG
ncbi:tetratricopeptide repeat protein [Methanobacterium petrolearium]|uniref:tetratricopeptide repeat protein n=1 Tax=Methanobacterium petrolearium TaxID=710190 RepID=UPI001AE4C34D|nr:tetratricopeptide repeat protein [Methanobacterium petrolearium]MBP1945386.1 tetratricopeptide (TPR) repeat protein [Methanobacterium petrolearium]